ncbi:hypothetical protein C8Q74DRAFT_1271551 [Fomes fomentarius]|nr:hypothetical protein C8Q74DRAFT_1271551 [Fomes fomentarius]
MPPRGLFSNVPNELLVRILSELDVLDLLTCRAVCRRLESLIRDDMTLQYKVELGRAGMIDGLPGKHPLHKRLERLRVYQRAWRSPNVVLSKTTSLPPSHSDRVWPLEDEGLLASHSGVGLDFCRPSSSLRGIPAATVQVETKEWPEDIRSGLAHGCAIDVQQDLLALAPRIPTPASESKCHLFSLSQSGLSHPLAANPLLLMSFPERMLDRVGGQTQHLEILGNLIVWTVWDLGQVQVWNWQEGVLLWEIATRDLLKPIYCRLLDSSTLLVAHGDELSIYDIRDTGASRSHSSPVTGTATARDYICRLGLPIRSFDSATDKMFLDMQRPSDFAKHHPPFAHDSSLTTIAMCFSFGRGFAYMAPRAEHLVFLIPVCTVFAAVDRVRNAPGATTRTIPWDEWGPSGARLIQTPEQPDFTVLGSKFAAAFYPETRWGEPITGADVYIIDLNPAARSSSGKTTHVNFSEQIRSSKTTCSVLSTTFPCTLTRHTVVLQNAQAKRFRLVLFHDGWALLPTLDEGQVHSSNKPVGGYMFLA